MTSSFPPTTYMPVVTDVRLGTDLVFVPRLLRIYQRYGDAFFKKLLTEAEWTYCLQGVESTGSRQQIRRAAGRIAVKEAVSKALECGLNGLGWNQGVSWREIEVVSQRQAPPQVCLRGKAVERAKALGLSSWRLSLSHDGDYALATVVGLITSEELA